MTRADDALKYALALFAARTEWAHTATADAATDDGDGPDVGFLDAALCEIEELALLFGDQDRYSNGRLITSRAVIEPGFYTEHIWHPDPTRERILSWRGDLLPDDDDRPRGRFQVSIDPTMQNIHVLVMRLS